VITFVSGDIFSSPAQVVTNTINIVGVMGKGLALAFKTRYPTMFADYQRRCSENRVRPGEPYLWEDDRTQILNFPTKRHWRDPSHLEDVEAGLKYLAANYRNMGILSIALPPLGCGLGGLKWQVVRPLIEKHLGALPDLEVFVYEPAEALSVDRDDKAIKPLLPTERDKVAAMPV